jgi:hypothetical protein
VTGSRARAQEIAAGNHLRFAAIRRIDQEGRQDSRQPGKIERGCRGAGVVDRFGQERTFKRVSQVERRIGEDPRLGQRERIGAADQHRRFRRGSLALVGELECRGAGAGDQHARCGRARGKAGFGGEQTQHSIDLDRPAVPQRIERQRDPPGCSHNTALKDRTP